MTNRSLFPSARRLAAAAALWVVLPGGLSGQDVEVSSEPAAGAADTATALRGEAVVVRGDTLFRLHGRVGPFSAADRARAIERRLDDIIRNPSLDAREVGVAAQANARDITVGDVLLMTITSEDATGAGRELDVLARDYATAIQVVLEREIEAFSLTRIALGALYTVLATALLFLLLRLFSRVFPAIYRFIATSLPARIPPLNIQDFEVISGSRLASVLLFGARAVRFAATVLLLYLYLPLVLSFFPWTRRLSGEIVGWVVRPLAQVIDGMLGYLPSLFTILVILTVTYYGIKLVKQFFRAIEQGSIKFSGFYPEWARPTYKIVRFLIIALAVIMIWPYLPNSESQAFRGVAAFLGLLITFGSAGMIANVVGGIMLTYMRAFRVGDRVRIADTVGDVIEQNLLVTRVRTSKSVDVTIPNSLVLGAHIINWSTTAREGGVLLHTTVTIGYDVPWRRVHELLVAAARATDGITAEREPFVVQTALNDFHVSYELNAWTLEPERMLRIHSNLHQNIQDRFNEAGVEIMSPHYGAMRDGNTTAIPEDYLPPDYRPQGFLFRRK